MPGFSAWALLNFRFPWLQNRHLVAVPRHTGTAFSVRYLVVYGWGPGFSTMNHLTVDLGCGTGKKY
jgi:hypothetical protein